MWSTKNYNGGLVVDHPTFVYDPVYELKYIVFAQASNGKSDLALYVLDSSLQLHYYSSLSSCANYRGAALVPRATVDAATGNVHIVYLDTGTNNIVHETFFHNYGGFACQNGCGSSTEREWRLDPAAELLSA